MALNVGELVAYLRLDDQEFQRTLSKSGSGLRSFGQSARSMLQPVATAFAASTTAGAAFVASLARQGVAYNTLQQQSRAALTSITGSAEKANAQMDKLDDFARNSPFSKATFITAQQQMLGFGIESKKVIPYLDSIQNAVAAIGGSNQDIADISLIMAQISSAGKITGQDLLQFGARGINAAKMIADAMGVTEGEIRERITKGTLDADDALDALAKGMATTYKGAAEGVKNTWVGATDRIKAAMRDLGSVLAAPFVDPHGGGMALEWANGLADLMRAVEAKAKPLVESLLPKIVPISQSINEALQQATRAVKDLDVGDFVADMGKLGEYAVPLSAAAGALFAMGTNVGILARFGLSLNPFVAALVAVVASSEDARTASVRLVKALAPLGDHLLALVKAGGDLANTVLSGLSAILLEIADGANKAGGPVDLLAMGIDALTGAVKFVNAVVGPLADWLVQAASAAEGLSGPIAGVTLALIAMRNVDIAKTLGALSTGLSNARQTWQASQGTLQALGQEAGTMNTAMLTAREGVTRLGGALKTALVANAPMLAITALAAVIGHFAQVSAEAKAKSESLAGSLDELTGAATTQTDKLVIDQISDGLKDADWDVLEKAGLDMATLTAAVEGDTGAQMKYQQALAEVEKQQGLTGGTRSRLVRTMDESTEAYDRAQESAQRERDALQQTGDAADELAGKFTNYGDKAQDLADGLRTISDEAASADDKLRALNDVLDILAGGTLSAEDAAFKYADTVRKTTEDVEGFKFSQKELNDILNDDGSLNTQSEAAGKLRDAFKGLKDNANETAISLQEAGDTEGISANYEQLNSDIDDMAASAGLSTEQVNALKESLGILPPEVMTDIVVNGEDAKTDINAVMQTLGKLPPEVTSFIYGNTDDLDTKVNHADLRMAYAASLSADPNIGANDKENIQIVAAALQRLDELDKEKPTPEINAEKAQLEKVVAGSKLDLDSIKDKNVDVNAYTHGKYDVDSLKSAISGVRSKTVTVRTNFVETGKKTGFSGVVGNKNGTHWADGGVIESFANGAENHVAQIAPGGSWRVWAEPETGGEAYVPLSPSKRPRSLLIMQDVAERFGYAMVPVNARQYADGDRGFTPAPSGVQVERVAAGGIHVGRDLIVADPDELFREQKRQERVQVRMSMAGRF